MKNKAPLMLMEQIVMLLVFAIAAALCVQAFVKSEELSTRSESRDRAVVEVQTAAETLRYYSGDYSRAAEELGYRPVDGGFFARFDRDWRLLSDPDGEYEYELTAERLEPGEDGLGCAAVRVMRENEEQALFSVEVMWQEVSADG